MAAGPARARPRITPIRDGVRRRLHRAVSAGKARRYRSIEVPPRPVPARLQDRGGPVPAAKALAPTGGDRGAGTAHAGD
jgi:hypothetical protein